MLFLAVFYSTRFTSHAYDLFLIDLLSMNLTSRLGNQDSTDILMQSFERILSCG
jgi:hypothetical protein